MNKSLFPGGVRAAPPNATNDGGGQAYAMDAKHALAQAAMTGTLSDTFYTGADVHLDRLLNLLDSFGSDPVFVAKAAVYGHAVGRMKDVPALLLAWLAVKAPHLASAIFSRVATGGKMLRNVVAVLRSGKLGRKTVPRPMRRNIEWFLRDLSPWQTLRYSVGNQPSLGDIVAMVHPAPRDAAQAALWAWMLGKAPKDGAVLPEAVAAFQAFQKAVPGDRELPQVPFSLLEGEKLSPQEWAKLAGRYSFSELRQSLNTLLRHDAFKVDKELVSRVERIFADDAAVRRSRVMPYQILATIAYTAEALPLPIRATLLHAMEVAVENVPAFDVDEILVGVDVSGSMNAPVTGGRKGQSSKIMARQAAGLFAAAVAIRNRGRARIVAFHTQGFEMKANALLGGTLWSIQEELGKFPDGGTDVSVPLRCALQENWRPGLVLILSDNESWALSGRHGTATADAWQQLRSRRRDARLVCLDLCANQTIQAQDSTSILNVGGFSDRVFEVVAAWMKGQYGPGFWVREIEKIELTPTDASGSTTFSDTEADSQP